MRAMNEREPGLRRAPLRVTWTAAPVAASFLVFAWLSTQVAALRAVLPFTEDPYDAVVSYGVIGIGMVGAATVFRVVVHARQPYEPAVGRRVALGAALAMAMAVVAFASDAVAVVVVGVDLGAPGARVMVGLLGIGLVASCVAAYVAWSERAVLLDAPPAGGAEPDLLDDLGAAFGAVGARRVGAWFASWSERSPFSPRRHRLIVGVVGGAVAGVGAVAWHAIREGPWASPGVAAVFGGLMAVGVLGAYLVALVPLRLLRAPGRAQPGEPEPDLGTQARSNRQASTSRTGS
jgi:hypothetical protein